MDRFNAPTAGTLVDYTLRLIAASSPSGREAAVANVIGSEMEALGLDVCVDEYGSVVGTVEAEPGPCVLLDCHIDTVGVADADDWHWDPSGERVDSRIYGRGAVDMKGPLAAALYGVAGLKPYVTAGRVVIAGTVAEELVEGPALKKVVERVEPDYVVICEATNLGLARGQRGRAELLVDVIGRSSHTSRPDLGANAAEVFADVAIALRQVPLRSHPMLGHGVLVLSDVMSRPYPGLSVVPYSCRATYDRRTLPGETREEVVSPLQAAADKAAAGTGARVTITIAEDVFTTYTGAQVTAENFAPAWICEDQAEILVAASSGLRLAGLPAELTQYAFCTNGSATAGELGIPTIGFGPGREDLAHCANEYVEIADLSTAAIGYAGIIQVLLDKGQS